MMLIGYYNYTVILTYAGGVEIGRASRRERV